MNIGKNILITGNKGFVGSNLSTYLQKNGFSIVGITRTSKTTNEISYDSLSSERWDESDAIIHLASKAHDLKGVANENEYFEVNTTLTKKLFQQFLKSNCSVFIYMSSVKAVADSVEGKLTENEIPNPKTAYGKSKLAAEVYLQSQKLPNNKKLYILRPCMIHGPSNKGNLNLLFSIVKKRFPWPLGAFENQRSFCSIENLSFVIKELLIQETIPSGIYNVADDEPLSTNKLIQIIATSQNKRASIVYVPKGFIKILAKLGDILQLPLNKERLQKLTESYVVSNKKIKQAMGKPFPVHAKDGLMHTFQSFQKN